MIIITSNWAKHINLNANLFIWIPFLIGNASRDGLVPVSVLKYPTFIFPLTSQRALVLSSRTILP